MKHFWYVKILASWVGLLRIPTFSLCITSTFNIWVSTQKYGKTPPNHPFVHRVWNHYSHHPFWGENPPLFLVQHPSTNHPSTKKHTHIPRIFCAFTTSDSIRGLAASRPGSWGFEGKIPTSNPSRCHDTITTQTMTCF